MNKLNINKRLLTCLLASSITILSITGCDKEKSDTLPEDAEIIDSNDENELESGITKEIEIPNESFKLEAHYQCVGLKDKKWRITDNKKMLMSINTTELPEDTKVWIDNIHIDTSIVSTQPMFNGVIQDTMDDRIHNSTMVGFPISNTLKYLGINQIEGQNDTFIQGTVYAYHGYGNGSVSEKRFLESDYLEKGVYANHIGIIYGLLIQGKDDPEPRGIDVYDDIYVRVYDTVKFEDDNNGRITYRKYNIDGSYETLSEEKAKVNKK